MAAEGLSTRQIREILRQKWTLGRSHREVAGQLGAGLGTISGVERRARAAGLDWPQVEALSDAASVAIPVNREDLRVVHETIDEGDGTAGVREDGRPVAE